LGLKREIVDEVGKMVAREVGENPNHHPCLLFKTGVKSVVPCLRARQVGLFICLVVSILVLMDIGLQPHISEFQCKNKKLQKK
jgi:hypothetical protein